MDPEAVTATWVDALPPTGGTTGLVAKAMVRPLGGDAERLTVEENVPEDCIVRVEVAADPCVMVTVEGESEMLKSPEPVPIWTPRFVLVAREPLVPTTDST